MDGVAQTAGVGWRVCLGANVPHPDRVLVIRGTIEQGEAIIRGGAVVLRKVGCGQ